MPKLKVHIALLTVGLIYGANYTIAKSLMPDFIGPYGFILLRVAGALVFFGMAHQLWVREKVTSRVDFIRLFLCAVFGVAANMLCFFKGLSITSPINASVIMTVNPVLILGLSALILKERLSTLKVLGIIIGMIGALLLITDPFSDGKEIAGINWKGDLLILVNAISYAIYLILVKPLMAKYHAFTVVKWTFTFGLVMVIPFGLGELSAVEWNGLTLSILLRLLFVVLATTFLAYLLNAWALKHVNSSLVGVYIYLQPLAATFFAMLWGGYETHIRVLGYAVLIFAGVFLVSFKRLNKRTHG